MHPRGRLPQLVRNPPATLPLPPARPIQARRASIHERVSVKSRKREESGIFHASIRHHPPRRSAIKHIAVAPIRVNGVQTPACASGCNLNPAFDLDGNSSLRALCVCSRNKGLASGGLRRSRLSVARPDERSEWATDSRATEKAPTGPLLVRLEGATLGRHALLPQGLFFHQGPGHAGQVVGRGHNRDLPPARIVTLHPLEVGPHGG